MLSQIVNLELLLVSPDLLPSQENSSVGGVFEK